MALPSAAAASTATAAAWRIIPRPLLETILKNHAHHHRVPQPLLLHGPRGSGKTSLLLHRLLPEWNNPPHLTAYIDFAADAASSSDNHHTLPWSAAPALPAPLPLLRARLERELESMAERGVRLGLVGARDVFSLLNKRHDLATALSRVIGAGRLTEKDDRTPVSALWTKALLAFAARIGPGASTSAPPTKYSHEETAFMTEAEAALGLAKEVIEMHQSWRREATRHANRTGGFARSLVDSATDWPCLLLELLSNVAEVDFFQPKLVLNNIEVLRKAIVGTDDSTISGAMYHDSFLWRLLSLGVNERCLPVFIITSDSYYSYQAFIDFGFPDMFISRENFGWTNQEAKLHLVPNFFSEREWKVIEEVLGPNPRHLSEIYALKLSTQYKEAMHVNMSSFEDLVDAYLAYLQASFTCLHISSLSLSPKVTVVNPAMESALSILQKFASDVHEGNIPEDQLTFGSPWRHPPRTNETAASLKWAKVQLMDFVQSFANTEFGLNYLADYSLEILDDPSAVAMLEVGLLYTQRDPSFIRPVTRGIQRCLVRWLVIERMQMSLQESVSYFWQRMVRGRS